LRLRAASSSSLAEGRKVYGPTVKTASSELSKLRAQPRGQFRHPEGLGDVVVRAAVEAADDVLLGVCAGQHEDGHAQPLAAQPGAEFPPVAVGQADIEDDRVVARILAAEPGRGLRRAGGLGGGEFAVMRKLFAQRLAQRFVVIHHEDGSRARHPCSRSDVVP
jgi:hypothetical protein